MLLLPAPRVTGSGTSTVFLQSGCRRAILTSSLPATPALSQNAPNPFSGSCRIGFALPVEMPVTLIVRNSGGCAVRTLVGGETVARGSHEVSFNAAGLPSGMYYYELHAGGSVSVRPMLLTN
jgi:hypothetical protein